MNAFSFSFIIPVYNRPDEVKELLESFVALDGNFNFEIVIIEDGSTIDCKTVIEDYKTKLNIAYFFKPNSGPGDSRNYGMKNARGNYFIILDSDCLLPKQYLLAVNKSLTHSYIDCFGGPDTAHESFTNLQKAINFTMTSFITTGGIRGGKTKVNKFEPRSFNMGLSKQAFESSKGFGVIHPGEDPDLSIRLEKLGFKTRLIPEAYVFHKRRISWSKFYTQVNKFGMVRPILNQWHPETAKITYWLPTLFTGGFLVALLLLVFNITFAIAIYALYFTIAFVLALLSSKSIIVASQALVAIVIQFFGYGYGFFKSTFMVSILKNNPEKQFPHLFFKHVK